MKYKLQIFVPDRKKDIEKVINAATKKGAGIIGKYSHCAFIIKGKGVWKSEKGSKPAIGKVGEISRINEVKIEMHCPADKATAVKKAIKEAHPFEEPVIEFYKFEEV